MNIKEAKSNILRKWGSYPIIIWGPPGIGKTSLITQIAAEKKLEHTLIIRLAERPVEQLQGVVIPSLSRDSARFILPDNIVACKSYQTGLIFLDELDKADPYKFAAATHLLDSKCLGDFTLGDGWQIIAAANRESDSYLSNSIPPELSNRCAHIELSFDYHVWVEWARKNNINPDIINFHIDTKGQFLARYDLSGSKAFPTPRTWEMASRISSKYPEFIVEEIKDFCGELAGIEFIKYKTSAKYKKLIESILTGNYHIWTSLPQNDKILTLQRLASLDRAKVSPHIQNLKRFLDSIEQEYVLAFIKDLSYADLIE